LLLVVYEIERFISVDISSMVWGLVWFGPGVVGTSVVGTR